MASALFAPIEKALVRFQGMLARASMNQQDTVERLASKTGNIYENLKTHTKWSGIVRGSLQGAGACFNIVGAMQKSESWVAGAKACDAVNNLVSTYFETQRLGHDKVRELTQMQLSQQAASRSSMTNIEQYASTLEQRVDGHKQSSKQI